MKWLIASDIHGSTYYCTQLLQAFAREQCDRILLLGDLLYHGPRNNLPREYDPKQVIDMLNAHKDHILCVRGNCDAEVDQMVLAFPIMAEYAVLTEGKHLIYCTHGHVWNNSHLPALQPGVILLHGHTHVPAWDVYPTHVYLNPGSVSIPKNDSPHSYMTFEQGVFTWKSLEGDVYHTYTL